MKVHDKIPVIALVVIVVIVAGAGPLLGLAHTLHLDLNIAGILLGGLAAVGVCAFLFHEQLAGIFGLIQRQVNRLEENDDEENYREYLQLPQTAGSRHEDLADVVGYAASGQVGTAPPTSEPVILLAPNCPLPIQDGLNHTLILERPGSGQRGRSVATRLYIEQIAAFKLPQIIITRNQSYLSLLPLLDNPWLAGKPEAREALSPHLQRYAQQVPGLTPGLELRYASLNEHNARSFAKKVLGVNAQVIVDLSTYSDPNEAGRVLHRLLSGLLEDLIACMVVLMEADKWFPNDRWLQFGHTFIKDAATVQQLRTVVSQLMATKHATVILSMDALMPADLRLVRKCLLWLLNMDPDDEDRPFISYQTGLTAPGLDCLQDRAILADVTTQTAMEMTLYRPQSAHEEQTERNTSGLLNIDLSNIAADVMEEPGLGKSMAEGGQEEDESRRDEPPSAVHNAGPATKAFTRPQLAYAVALMKSSDFTETALRRPPKTKRVREDLPVTFADLAQELRLKLALSDKDLYSPDRANLLWNLVQTLSEEERRDYEAEAEAAISAIMERRKLSEQPITLVQESEVMLSGGTPIRWPRVPIDRLFRAPQKQQSISADEVKALARTIQSTLTGQKVYADVLEEYIDIGDKVLSFGILPTGVPLMENGKMARNEFGAIVYQKETRIAEIMRLKNDLQARLRAKKIRMLDPVPGERFVGVEIPNPYPTTVVIRDILEDPEFQRARYKSKLVIAVGRDLSGRVVVLDLEDSNNPHLLVGGSTGGGKSVCLNTILASLLSAYSPLDVRLMMIDAKGGVELGLYEGTPHLLGKILDEAVEAVNALKRAQSEMERRYKLFKQHKVRDIKGYRKLREQDPSLEHLPSIVIIGDEIAALMDKFRDLTKDQQEELGTSPEALFSNIGRLGRAAGIHLILCTQRPTVDVITGDIKANIPARIALMVGQAIDSRVILDEDGAEELQGKGDGILKTPESPCRRIQCAFITDEEVQALVAFWIQALPQSGEEGAAPLDISQLRQQTFLDLALAPDLAEPAPANEDAEQASEDEQESLDEHIAAFLNGEKLSFALTDLPNEKLYRFVEAWTLLRQTVTRDEIRVCFGISQAKAGTMITQLHLNGIIGEVQSGGRPRQVLAYKAATTPETLEETSV